MTTAVALANLIQGHHYTFDLMQLLEGSRTTVWETLLHRNVVNAGMTHLKTTLIDTYVY